MCRDSLTVIKVYWLVCLQQASYHIMSSTFLQSGLYFLNMCSVVLNKVYNGQRAHAHTHTHHTHTHTSYTCGGYIYDKNRDILTHCLWDIHEISFPRKNKIKIHFKDANCCVKSNVCSCTVIKWVCVLSLKGWFHGEGWQLPGYCKYAVLGCVILKNGIVCLHVVRNVAVTRENNTARKPQST